MPYEEIRHCVTYRFVGGKPEDGLLSCGFMRKKNAQKSQIDYTIPYYSCFVLLNGSGEYWDETGFRAALHPGSVVQRLPGRRHSTRVDDGGQWLEFYISFGNCVFDAMCALGLLPAAAPVLELPQPEKQITAFQELLERMTAAPDRLLLPCLLQAQQLAHTMTSLTAAHTEPSETVVQACAILEKDLLRELPLEAVAQKLCIGYETFRKQFQAEMHVSPDEYRQQRRMTTAQTMLMAGTSVKAAAKALGYSDAYAFSKQFKRFFGCSPTAYIRQHT